MQSVLEPDADFSPPETRGTEGDIPALEIRGLSKSFGKFVALQDIDLDIKQGEFVCFLGPSGCGKTTLLRAIAGLSMQNVGTIRQNGRDISYLPVTQRDFGIVFQSYALFPNLSVERNVGYGLHRAGLSREARRARVDELLQMVGLEGHAKKYPAQLSGGQQQRVALARALAPSPGLLLLDEPLSALDAQVRIHLRDQLTQLQRSLGVTTIMVTHDQNEALAIADRIVVMNHGKVEQIGTPEDVFSNPASPFVAGFLGDMNFIPGIVRNGRILAGEGLEISAPKLGAFADGREVSFCIRPADIEIGPLVADLPNKLDARIETISFRGNFYYLVLDSPVLGQKLEVEISSTAWPSLDLHEGSMITIAFPEAKLHVFPKDQ